MLGLRRLLVVQGAPHGTEQPATQGTRQGASEHAEGTNRNRMPALYPRRRYADTATSRLTVQ